MDDLTMRAYESEDDYWRIRAFLRAVFLRNGRRRLCYETARLDYWRWHLVENVGIVDSLAESIFLWETAGGEIAAVLNAENRGEAVLNVHPDFRTPELEAVILDAAEARLGTPGKRFFVFAHASDTMRQDLLRRRGYSETGGNPEYQWRLDLTPPLPAVVVPDGYTVRPIGDVDELPSRSWASWRAFHPDEPDFDYEGWEWSLNWQRSPLYRRDLDIVAVAPDGTVAGYCVLWYDDATRAGLFNPVAVMPEHQRRGLGRAVMTEAMRRARSMGATLATVSGYDPPANAFYSAVLSPEPELNIPWCKTL